MQLAVRQGHWSSHNLRAIRIQVVKFKEDILDKERCMRRQLEEWEKGMPGRFEGMAQEMGKIYEAKGSRGAEGDYFASFSLNGHKCNCPKKIYLT